jgi:ABC-type multidrug transport system ATPase subunit
MTVREHLQFYGRLKGNMSSKELDRDINEYVHIENKLIKYISIDCLDF